MRCHFATCTHIIALLCILSSCSPVDTNNYDDLSSKINELESRYEQMNNNISSLQSIISAIQSSDYITDVSPIDKEGNTIGYLIRFAKNGTVTIYNGEDGKDGNDGTTPVIGVKQTSDNKYYWTINGEWLLDSEGMKIMTSGKDGITPQIKEEQGKWYVSYDNGASWQETGSANSTPLISDIDSSDENYIVLSFLDGSKIKIPTWHAFESLNNRVDTMNSNIAALSTLVNAIDRRDYINNVEPIIKEGKTVGYKISFFKEGPIEIYNGKDGSNGTNGSSTDMPIIGIKQDSDNNWYWIMNGEWMVDEQYNKIKANGTTGENGVTPRIKIEDDYWFVSYDNGDSWSKLDKAKGETGPAGASGQNGKDGDSFFKSVDATSEPDCVVFTFSDSSTIKIPRLASFRIGTDDNNDVVVVSGNSKTVDLTLPSNLTKSSFALLQAKIDDNSSIATKASSSWSITIKSPTFDVNDCCNNDASITIETPSNVALGETVLVEVSLLLANGNTSVTKRLFKAGADVPGAGNTIISNITAGGASATSYVVSDDRAAVSQWGICYSKSNNPDINSSAISASSSIPGTFTVQINGLDNGSTYYVRSFATNSNGTAYGPVTSFSTAAAAIPGMTNLSADGTSNCYIITSAGSYSFDASVIGNGRNGIISNSGFHTDNTSIIPKSAKLLWEDVDGLISGVTLSGTAVSFVASADEGNAVIAVYSGTNCTGDILWSWHIWCTDRPNDVIVSNSTGNYTTMLDRNIGAISADPADGIDTYGLYYQYGRKDPFPTARDNYNTPIDARYNTVQILDCIQHPTTFYGHTSPQTYDQALWGNPTGDSPIHKATKTIYDPCPTGYMVAEKESFELLSKDGSLTFNEMAFAGGWHYGWNFYTTPSETSTIWFPAAGHWDIVLFRILDSGAIGEYITSTNNTIGPITVYLSDNARGTKASHDSNNDAFQVRCIKE